MNISKTVYNALLNEWGPQDWWPATSSLEMMIGAILTQNTSWTQVEKAIQRLKDENALNMEKLASIPSIKFTKLIIAVKNIIKNNDIKIYGNPELKVSKNITIKNYLKDHRVFMTSVVAALCFGGNWKIHDKNSINTSFPSFLDKLKLKFI